MSESLYCRTCARIQQVRYLPHGLMITLLSRVITLLGIIVLIGMLPWLSGTDPAMALLRARSAEQEATPEALAAIRQSLGLDQGPVHLLINWLSGLLQGDAGNSWVSGRPVLPGMMQAAQVSLTLMLMSAAVALVMAAIICLPTFRRGLQGHTYRSTGFFASIFTSLPEFLLASFLLVVGAVWLKWFPPYGWSGLHYAVLPALAMGIPAGGYLGRIFSDALAATFSENWVITWTVAGIVRWHIICAVLKRTLSTIMPLFGLILVSLTGSAVAVEKVFAIPGLGRATLGAVVAQDLPALQTGILFLLIIAFMFGILAAGIRYLILGSALRSSSLPVTTEPDDSNRKLLIVLPVICGVALTLLLLAGLPRDPYTSEFLRLAPPSLALPFGADAMGRDLLARVAHGTVHTCFLALMVSMICLVLGLVIGLFPRVFVGPTEMANALPPVIAGLLVVSVSGPGSSGAAIAIAAVGWAPLATHTAALATEIRARAYISMLPVLGAGWLRQNLFYVFPALIGPLFRHAMLRLPGIALALASLGFLGLGASPPEPEWGRVLAEGMPYLERAYWVVLAPASALALLSVMGVSLAGLTSKKHSRIQ
ncbi:ABC transporter permease subunit [Klebsiella pneumoniae]|uniref:ABC transporter permease subunit n=1 Tax=Enterobacteriaceae TaxID=543 RepID=UPI000C76D3D1|nr:MULTISPECIES: ABC transporter permease subunit [Enterobacteriaceae]HAN1838070.1 ABC transporter permease subunit [Escherichia coli]HBC5606907.1 ABC transporter permease subunit [Klebsiella oxytoca]HCB3604016.1 ABC transporter permease subunit [Klebsiella aerogenes]HDG1673922.1 ABC transporter permease subunit [Kluyvera cryocrescens]HEF0063610.1 ABC transporter permease subunit [Citrobacter pasteurii]